MRPLSLRLIADLTAARAARRQLKSWLENAALAADDRNDLLLAVDEAITNVVDHAYTQFQDPGEVVVTIEMGQHPNGRECIVASVSDRGRWRPPPLDPGYRGRGLPLMKCCTAWLRIEHSDLGGTRVVMATTSS